jgi:hypothetical protein
MAVPSANTAPKNRRLAQPEHHSRSCGSCAADDSHKTRTRARRADRGLPPHRNRRQRCCDICRRHPLIHYLKNCFVLRSDLLKHRPPPQLAEAMTQKARAAAGAGPHRASDRSRPRRVEETGLLALRMTRLGEAAREKNIKIDRILRRERPRRPSHLLLIGRKIWMIVVLRIAR